MSNLANKQGGGNKEEQKFETLLEYKEKEKSNKDIAAFVVGLRNANIPDKDIPNALTSMGVSMEDAVAFMQNETLKSFSEKPEVSEQMTPPPAPDVKMANPNPRPQAKQKPVSNPEQAAYEKAMNVAKQSDQQRRQDALKNDEGVGSIFKVPTVEVDLPSGGLFYNGKSSVTVKYLTAAEDDILFSPELIQKNKAIDALLDAVVQDRDLRPSDMLTGDRNYLVMFIRRTGFGDMYDTGAMMCPSCGHIHSPEVDLSQLKMKELMYQPDENGWYGVKMPTMKVNVKFRFLTGKDEDYLSKKMTASAKKVGGVRVPAILTEKYLLQIMEVDGQTDKIFIKSFIDAMPMMDSHFFREYVAQIEPGIDLNYAFECPSCGHVHERDIPIGPKLFYPNSDL